MHVSKRPKIFLHNFRAKENLDCKTKRFFVYSVPLLVLYASCRLANMCADCWAQNITSKYERSPSRLPKIDLSCRKRVELKRKLDGSEFRGTICHIQRWIVSRHFVDVRSLILHKFQWLVKWHQAIKDLAMLSKLFNHQRHKNLTTQ